jgi:hypothetical protein
MYCSLSQLSFVEVEHRRAGRDLVPRERLDHLRERELLPVTTERKAHRAEEVEQRVRQDPGVSVVVDRDRVLALADLGLVLVGVAEQAHVDPHGLLPAERAIQHDVLRRRRDPLLGAADVRDLHQVIVDDVREVIGRHAVGLEQHLIVGLAGVAGDVPAQLIPERDLALGRHLQAHDARLPRGGAIARLGGIDRAARAVVADEVALLGLLLQPHLREPILGAEAAVGLALVEQDVDVLLIDGLALGLAVRPERATYIGALVPRQPGPAQRIEDHLFGVGAGARLIGVLDPEHELAALLLREHEVEQRDVGSSDVGVPRRRWCNAHTYGPSVRHGSRA